MNLDHATRWIEREIDSGRIRNAVFGWVDSHGSQDVRAFGEVAPDARYALFSITKPVVALAAVRAIERGELSLRSALADALPGFGASHVGTVRLEHLLSHTAGLIEPRLDDPRPLREVLRAAPQQFLPGAATRYSSLAFEGVAALLEHHTGRDLEGWLAEMVALMGASGLSFDRRGAQPVDRAADVGFDIDTFVAHRHPGAGLFGAAEDLLRLGHALLEVLGGARDGVVRLESLRSMLRVRTRGLPEHVPEPQRREFGLGWQLSTGAGVLDDSGFGHGGWAGTQWWFYPAPRACAVLLTSVADAPRWGIDTDALRNAVGFGLSSQ